MKLEYEHGGDIYSRPVALDYSANINPLGLPEGVKKALLQGLEEGVFSVYPDSRCSGLRGALGEYYQVPADWILCGNGAADLIFGLAEALRPGRALLPAPTFLEYGKAPERVRCCIDSMSLKE